MTLMNLLCFACVCFYCVLGRMLLIVSKCVNVEIGDCFMIFVDRGIVLSIYLA